MPYLSEKENLEIDWNYAYSRRVLCNYMNIEYVKEEIERGIFKPNRFPSILIFSTIDNHPGYPGYLTYLERYINGKISDNEFLYSSNNQSLDPDITQHQIMKKELLLFVRKDDTTDFYYFGRCNYSHEYNLPNYPYPLYCLELMDTRFSDVRDIEIPDLSS